MADLKFKLPASPGAPAPLLDSAYLTGIEGIPWQSRCRLSGDQFSIGREIDESGKLNLLWPTESLGDVCLSTTSLRLVETPYLLDVELARGTVNRLRTQASEWQRIGLRLPEDYFPAAELTLEQFLKSVTCRDREQQSELAKLAIDGCMQASVKLCDTYSAQALEARKQSEGRLSTLSGIELANRSLSTVYGNIDSAFNLVSVPVDLGAVENDAGKQDFTHFDSHIEWAGKQAKKLCVGPLVNFATGKLPRWMVLLDEGFESIMKSASKHAEACVQRYRGKAHIWNCAAGLNMPSELGWTDEETLRMAVAVIETVRRADNRSPVLLTIDQPWSEYLRKDNSGISPLHFADALIRADLGLSGLSLDLRFGNGPGESYPRDLLEISRLIDRWAMLGLPLMVQLGSKVPATEANDTTGDQTLAPESIFNLLLSKPCVHAVIWTSLIDSPTEATKNGLWDEKGHPKPLIRKIATTRAKYLH